MPGCDAAERDTPPARNPTGSRARTVATARRSAAMYARSFGATRVPVPVIGQGTWHIDGADRADAIRALRAGIDAGMTHIDTAEMYGDAEAIVAAAIADCREEVFLVSKVVPGNATRRGVARACEASLRRLRTDRLDSYLLHWPGQHPLEETIAGFEDLRRAGQDPVLGRQQFRRREPRPRARHRGAGPDRLQSGALPSERAGDRTCRAALVREARRRHGRLLALRQR